METTSTDNQPWLVLYTKARAEKKTAESLANLGIKVYCPVRKVKKKWSDRWKWVEEPLFSSYIFVQIDKEHRNDVFSVAGVVRYLFWLGQPAIVRQQELDQLKKWLGEYDNDLISLRFLPEDRVRVGSGPLMESSATVINQKGSKLVLLLEGLNAEVTVDLKKNAVEKISKKD